MEGPSQLDLSQALDLEDVPIKYDKTDYILTASGNKVSKYCYLCGAVNICLLGKSIVKPGVIMRGDLQLMRLGRYIIVGDGSVLRPPYKKYKGNVVFYPMTVGDYVTIGPRCIISAAQVGSCVTIGEDSIISKRCVLKDCSVILPGTVLPPDTIVPPLTVFGGSPGRYVADLPESVQVRQKADSMMLYKRFQPANKGLAATRSRSEARQRALSPRATKSPRAPTSSAPVGTAASAAAGAAAAGGGLATETQPARGDAASTSSAPVGTAASAAAGAAAADGGLATETQPARGGATTEPVQG